jgi:hypothetical protein
MSTSIESREKSKCDGVTQTGCDANASGLHHGNAAKDAADKFTEDVLQLTILADTERQTFNLDIAPTLEATLAIKRCAWDGTHFVQDCAASNIL